MSAISSESLQLAPLVTDAERGAPTPTYVASDGYELRYRHWPTDQQLPRAMIVGVHGIQSHSGWYAYSCSRLAEAGYDTYFLDRRGSGLNSARRGFAVHEDRLVNDVAQFLSGLRYEQQRRGIPCPIVLMGVSWGGKLAATVGCRRPDLLDSLALLYPGICPKFQPSLWQRYKLWMAVQKDWGRFHIPIPLNEPELFTDEPRWQEYIRQDRLALREVTVSFMAANLRMSRYLRQHLPEIAKPILLMQSGRDQIIDNAATNRLFAKLTRAEITRIEYPEARHTLEFEPKPDMFIDDLLEWLAGVMQKA